MAAKQERESGGLFSPYISLVMGGIRIVNVDT
jgi:hypothetical protein